MGCILLDGGTRRAQRVGKKSTPSVEAAMPVAIASSSGAAENFKNGCFCREHMRKISSLGT
jgi:hypothetical protein